MENKKTDEEIIDLVNILIYNILLYSYIHLYAQKIWIIVEYVI